MNATDITDRLERALAGPPTESGGIAIVLATAGVPPAMALLSSGDVHISGKTARVGIYATSSAVTRLGGAFTLLVPLGDLAVRVEVSSATAIRSAPLALLEGEITSVRPTTEPPWVLEMGFFPESENNPAIPGFIEYWKQVKSWLVGQRTDVPQIPDLADSTISASQEPG